MTTKAAQHKAAQLEKRLRNAPEFKDLIAGGLLTIWCYADGVSIVTQADLEGEEATDYNGDGLGAFVLYEEARKTIGELVRRRIELLANEAAVRDAHDAAAAEAQQEAAANHDDEDTFTARYGIVHADKDGRAVRVIVIDGLQFTAHALNELAYAALDEWAGRYTRAAVTLGRHGVTADGHVAVQVTEDRIVPA